MRGLRINNLVIFALLLWVSINVIDLRPVFAAPGAHGPNGEHLTEESSKTSTEIGRQADGSVIMPMAMQAKLQIQTQFAESGNAQKTLSLSGVVKPHNRGYAIVQPGNNGQYLATEYGAPLSGTEVKKGDLLGFIQYSDTAFELASQNSELLSVRNNIEQTRRDVQRLENLGELASEQQLEQLKTQLKTLVEQEVALQAGVEKPLPLIAQQDGILLNHQVTNGKWVKAGTILFEIVDPDLRKIEVHTNQFNIINQVSSASLQEYPELEVNYLGHSPTLKEGLMTLFFEHECKHQHSQIPLPIDQHVTVLVKKADEVQGIVLPSDAVVTNRNNLPIVWIKVSAERFLPQIVEYQAVANGLVVITDGLGSENRVVVNGTSLLNQVR